MDEENDLVVDFFPGATNTDLLKETLDDLLPCKSYVLDTIKGTAAKFKADFYISSSTEAEAESFVESYCQQTREVLRSATSK